MDFSKSEHAQPVLARIFEEQIQGIVYRQLKHLEIHFPVARSLENAYYADLVSNTYRINAVKDLETRLSGEKIPVLIIKGMALIKGVYPDPGMRPMEDIDAVIRLKDYHAVEKILISCGYATKPGYPLMFEKKGITIDLHTDLFHTHRIQSRKYLCPLDMEQVWENSLPWEDGFSWVRRPDNADHFIFLCHHMIKHSFSKLMWLYDARQILIHQGTEGLQKLARLSAKYRQQRPMGYVLYLLEKMLGYKSQDSALAGYCRQLTWFEKQILNIRVKSASMGDLGNVLWMFCLPGFKQRLLYAEETLFPKKEVMRREQSLAPHPTRSIYANRILLLCHQLLLNLILVFQSFLRRKPS